MHSGAAAPAGVPRGDGSAGEADRDDRRVPADGRGGRHLHGNGTVLCYWWQLAW